MPKTKKAQNADDRNMVGIVNRGGSVRFILFVDSLTNTYDISTLGPYQIVFTFMPKHRRKVKAMYEIYDSMDDLHQGISELARGFKENKSDHVHCSKGAKEHIHKLDSLGLKIGKCPTKDRSCGSSHNA